VKDLGLPRITLHGLRHTAATLLLDAGTPVKVVSEMLGHANASITLNIYAHAVPGAGAAAPERRLRSTSSSVSVNRNA
jgi:integrase